VEDEMHDFYMNRCSARVACSLCGLQGLQHAFLAKQRNQHRKQLAGRETNMRRNFEGKTFDHP